MAKSNILSEIIAHKKKEVENLPEFEFYVKGTDKLPECKGFYNALNNAIGPALIAEVKKASPSKGVLREDFNHLEIAKAYKAGGAHCLSVLTDKQYFQGDLKYLKEISKEVKLPCLRKDFIIDKRQIVEARLAGADAILLIAAALNDHDLHWFYEIAIDLGMDVLMEVHDEAEMARVLETPARLIGINNRNLQTFNVSLETTTKLIEKFHAVLENRLVVTESGINSHADLNNLYDLGVKAFLVGESLVKQDNIADATSKLLLG